MFNSLFVVILRYIVDIQLIDDHRAEHIKFLEKYYAEGIFLTSGRQKPSNGGVILARCSDRQTLASILKTDPFAAHNLAEYQIFEFLPNRFAPGLEDILTECK